MLRSSRERLEILKKTIFFSSWWPRGKGERSLQGADDSEHMVSLSGFLVCLFGLFFWLFGVIIVDGTEK